MLAVVKCRCFITMTSNMAIIILIRCIVKYLIQTFFTDLVYIKFSLIELIFSYANYLGFFFKYFFSLSPLAYLLPSFMPFWSLVPCLLRLQRVSQLCTAGLLAMLAMLAMPKKIQLFQHTLASASKHLFIQLPSLPVFHINLSLF